LRIACGAYSANLLALVLYLQTFILPAAPRIEIAEAVCVGTWLL
jgi:hypothetical protein